jgi:hypothetical protein
MSSRNQVSQPIQIKETSSEYSFNEKFFDPFQSSPPNIFINHLKHRIDKIDKNIINNSYNSGSFVSCDLFNTISKIKSNNQVKVNGKE